MAKTNVVVETELKGGAEIRVVLNGKAVPGVNGRHTRAVSGGEQSLLWFVLGPPGSSYKLEVTEPTNVGFATAATLDLAGKDHGNTWFTI